MTGGTFSLKSTPKDRFLISRRNICFSYFRFDDWPGVRNSGVTYNNLVHFLLDYGDFKEEDSGKIYCTCRSCWLIRHGTKVWLPNPEIQKATLVHERWDLQFKVHSERQIFEKLWQSRRRNIFFFIFSFWWLTWGPTKLRRLQKRGFWKNILHFP